MTNEGHKSLDQEMLREFILIILLRGNDLCACIVFLLVHYMNISAQDNELETITGI